MRRRDLAAFFGSLIIVGQRLPRAAESPVFRVGRIAATPLSSPGWIAFEQRLVKLGYQEGRNLKVEFLDVGDEALDIPTTVAELSRRDLDVIVAGGPEIALKVAMQATHTIPIVMVAIDYDPLARGYIGGLARPGGNVTGVFLQQPELGAKRVELLKEAIPKVNRAVLFWDAISADQVEATASAATFLGIAVDRLELRHAPYNYRKALSQGGSSHADALVVLSSPIFFRERVGLAEFALNEGLPLMSPFRQLTEVGGLLSYGASVPGMYRRAADYVDKIAKGAKPTDLPVEQPTEFELIINLKTAKALGITVPQSILARADEVIE